MDLDFDDVNRILVQGTWFRGDLVGSWIYARNFNMIG